MMQKLSLRHFESQLSTSSNTAPLSFSEIRVHFLWAGPNDVADVVRDFVKPIAMASNSGTRSSSSSESSRESSLALSYECSSFGSGDENEPERVHPFLYEPKIASGSDEGGSSSSLT